LGETLDKLRKAGYLNSAEIRQFQNTGSSSICSIADPYGADIAFSKFVCGDKSQILRARGGSISLVTTLPVNITGANCVALFMSSDLPEGLRRFKFRISVAVASLLFLVSMFLLLMTLTWHKKMVAMEMKNQMALAENKSRLGQIAAQVAHDIRSPLAALDSVIKSTTTLPEDQRIMVRHAVNRIRDIANNLLEKNRQQDKDAPVVSQSRGETVTLLPCLLSSVLDPVITEKRLQFESKPGIAIDFELSQEAYGLFASINPVEFKRIISNLVNNSVEALADKGSVDIKLSREAKDILIAVSDNGKGIPEDVLVKIGNRGETHGKTGGSGLGLFHARTTVEAWGGSLHMDSKQGKGTTVTIRLPEAQAPANFISVLALSAGVPVVVLDDDTSIHQVWQERFDSARVKDYEIEVLHFSKPDKLRAWVNSFPDKAGLSVYLFDYELLNYKETGLSLARELGIASKVILVTSRYEEKGVIDESEKLNIRMIPKGLAGFVPIAIKSRPSGSKKAVLLDDDALVHMTWKVAARSAGVEFKSYKKPEDFAGVVESMPKDTPLYIDSELGDDIKGENIAKDLHDKGFTDITMATGHTPDQFAHLQWLKVIGKDPPFGKN
jgi:signal transduction histidine kinase